MENLVKSPVLVGFNTVFAVLMILILGFLGSGAYANATDSYNYYAVTLIIFAMLNGAMTASNCFMERDIKKPNLRIINSPVGSFPIYFSKILSSFTFDYSAHLLIMAILCPILNLNLGGRNIGYIILLMAPIEFASAALGTFFCCVFKNEETTSTLLSNVISVLCVLGGAFFSFDGLGGALAFASRISPVKWLIDSFFAIIYDGDLSSVLPVLLSTVVISVLLVFGCTRFFKTEDYIC